MATTSRQVAPDASLIGKHCGYEYCRQLDFLPFACQSCASTFCLDHRTEAAHACVAAGAWAARQRQAQLTRPSIGAAAAAAAVSLAAAPGPCAAADCDVVVRLTRSPATHCTRCRRDYCLRHRLWEDHQCASLVPRGPASPSPAIDVAARTRAALDRLRAWGAARAPASAKAIAARVVTLNTLKRTARGDARLPAEKRVYVHVEAEADRPRPGADKAAAAAAPPSAGLYFSVDWVVGRVLDAAARELQIANVNNQADDEAARLHLFHVEAGRLLDFGERFGTAVASGNTVVLLRGVGPPPPPPPETVTGARSTLLV